MAYAIATTYTHSAHRSSFIVDSGIHRIALEICKSHNRFVEDVGNLHRPTPYPSFLLNKNYGRAHCTLNSTFDFVFVCDKSDFVKPAKSIDSITPLTAHGNVAHLISF